MKRSGFASKFLAVVLTAVLLLGLMAPAGAAGTALDSVRLSFEQVDNSEVTAGLQSVEAELPEQAPYADTDEVRVSILLERRSTLEAGFSTQSIAGNAAAMRYRTGLKEEQAAVTASIERQALGGASLDVVWNLTLAANIISANVPYGKIDQIKAVDGVKDVVLETQYRPDVVSMGGEASPNMTISTQMNGSNVAWESGYTGAGTRIAIVDTGLDLDHQSFDPGAFDHAITEDAQKAGMSLEAYTAAKDFLDTAEIASVLQQLNVHERNGAVTAQQLSVNSKVPFGYNYVDNNLYLTHDEDYQSEHGSHVAGIAAANRYIPQGGGFVDAASAVKVVGNAPDAQLLVMKVFGVNGGAYDSDFMAAIEDAIILGCDSVNLSLGSPNPGMATNSIYQKLLDSFEKTDTVVVMSAGNAGNWAENSMTNNGHLYAEDVSLDTVGSPGSYKNTLAVASVDNDGAIGSYFQLGETRMVYMEPQYGGDSMDTLDPNGKGAEYPYLFIDGKGEAADYAGMDLTGKLVFCSRGGSSFAETANTAMGLGALGLVVYNNQPGGIYMNLSGYRYTAPCVSICQADGAAVKAAGKAQTTQSGLTYYTGTISIHKGMESGYWNTPYRTISSYSSWGVPGDLSLKPEVAAPGGNIYSVNGSHMGAPESGSDTYEVMSGTSMAAPQVTGMMALLQQYIEENDLHQKGLTDRALAQSLLMSTAEPLVEYASGNYYSLLAQGAGQAAVDRAIRTPTYLLVEGQPDGKVKAELGDDPDRTGQYTFRFSLQNLTENALDYTLSADLFTQAVFEDYVDMNQEELGLYMDTQTANLDALVSYLADGKPISPVRDLARYDFDGNGLVTQADAQLLLDHLIQGTALAANADHADVNGDGKVNTYDAHALLSLLNSGIVPVPARGSVTVEVTMALTEAQKQALDASYENGAYVEGFVRATPAPTREGEQGPAHSIPVLGFYGNWSDPSMFDVGSYTVYVNGQETRAPYASMQANSLLVRYASDPSGLYYFGGNPLVPDETYLPERNALNNENGDRLAAWVVTAIRNAANTRYTVKNVDTDEVLKQEEAGELPSAFFFTDYGQWANDALLLRSGFNATGLAEGTRLELTLELAPELYVQENGTTDWESLGKGTTRSVPLTIDNTAPELLDVSYNMISNTITAKARDNQYIAAVALFTAGGSKNLAFTGSNQEKAGETATFDLDLSEVNGKRFLLQVIDYANNTTTYRVDMTIGTPPGDPSVYGFDLEANAWIGFNMQNPSETVQDLASSENVFYAATDANGIMYATTRSGCLYVVNMEDPSETIYVCDLNVVFTDLAYNRADGKVYGVTDRSELYSVDPILGTVNLLGKIAADTNTLTCDDQGNFYCVIRGVGNDRGTLCQFKLDNISSPTYLAQGYQIGMGIQALEWNPNDGCVYWMQHYLFYSHGGQFEHNYNYIYRFDLETGTVMSSTNMNTHISCLTIPDQDAEPQCPEPTDQIASIRLSQQSLNLQKGEARQLRAGVLPWTVTDRSVTWTSTNPSVATVDENGLVTALANGETTIKVSSNLDSAKSASCTVTVENPQVALQGVVRDAKQNTELFTWNLRQGGSWTSGGKLDMPVSSAVSDPQNQMLYTCGTAEDEYAMYQVEPATGKILKTAPNSLGIPLWDMAYCELFSTEDQPMIMGIYGYYLLAPMDPMHLNNLTLDLSSKLSPLGASYVVAMAAGGRSTCDTAGFGTVEAELIYLLDDLGNVWKCWTYSRYDTYFSEFESVSTDLPSLDFAIRDNLMNCSMWEDRATGTLYLSYYDGSDTQIYRLTYDPIENTYRSLLLGDMGDGVGPAALYGGESYGTASQNVVSSQAGMGTVEGMPFEAMELQPIELQQTVTGGLNAVGQSETKTTAETPALRSVVLDEEAGTVTVTVPAAEAATNGRLELRYDKDVLSLTKITSPVQMSSIQQGVGSAVLGYAALSPISKGEPLAVLTFTYQKGTENLVTDVAVKTTERNDLELEETASIPVEFPCHGGSGCPSKQFKDLDVNAWYHPYTDYAISHEMMLGYENGTFGPGRNVTRGMVATVLYRLAGSPKVASTATFADVKDGLWYSDAVAWAQESGVAKGVTETRFAPNQPVTREQTATFLYRFMKDYEKVDMAPGADLSAYRDAAQISAYAQDAMAWANAVGLIEGVDANTLAPRHTATRAQLAKLLTILDRDLLP